MKKELIRYWEPDKRNSTETLENWDVEERNWHFIIIDDVKASKQNNLQGIIN